MLLDLLLAGTPEDASSSPSFEGRTKPHACTHMTPPQSFASNGPALSLQRGIVAGPKRKGCNGTRMTGPELDKYHSSKGQAR